MKDFEKRICAIEQRNKRVELDKAWETSIARRILISFFTYFIIVLFFFVAKLPKPFTNSLVPTIAFILSTLTLPILKKIWMRYKR